MNKKDREDVKAIVEEALKNNGKELRSVDVGDVAWCIFCSTILLTVFGAIVVFILNLAGIV